MRIPEKVLGKLKALYHGSGRCLVRQPCRQVHCRKVFCGCWVVLEGPGDAVLVAEGLLAGFYYLSSLLVIAHIKKSPGLGPQVTERSPWGLSRSPSGSRPAAQSPRMPGTHLSLRPSTRVSQTKAGAEPPWGETAAPHVSSVPTISWCHLFSQSLCFLGRSETLFPLWHWGLSTGPSH